LTNRSSTSATAHETTEAPLGTDRAHAKINLTLDVLGERPDGFHEIRSVVMGIGLHDRIRCRVTDRKGIAVTCSDPSIEPADNLAYRAAVKLAKKLGVKPAIEIEIEKNIPVGAGLGGGSSDAATTLRLCNHLWGNKLGDPKLAEVGAEIGSDIPLFFSMPAAIVTGRGEQVAAAPMCWHGSVLLVFPDEAISTVEVYDAWRPSDVAGLPTGMGDKVIRATTADELSSMLSNHLTPAVFRVSPRTKQIHTELQKAGLGSLHVTGTGSTLFRLFDEQGDACRAVNKIEERQLEVTTAVVAAPAGARLTASEE
jgi:4-diphosphocytidyl-2-C-methyl-D-erythritol kinase